MQKLLHWQSRLLFLQPAGLGLAGHGRSIIALHQGLLPPKPSRQIALILLVLPVSCEQSLDV